MQYRTSVLRLLNKLIDEMDTSDRNRDLLRDLWFHNYPISETARKYDISTERVRQIERDGVARAERLLLKGARA